MINLNKTSPPQGGFLLTTLILPIMVGVMMVDRELLVIPGLVAVVVLEMVILQVMVEMVSSSLLTPRHKLCYNT